MTGRPGLAFAAGLTYDINLQQLYIEAALLTEPLTTFFVSSICLGADSKMRRLEARRQCHRLALLTAAAPPSAIMMRPQFHLPAAVGAAAGRLGRARSASTDAP
jgi:hypothetical protein